MCVVGRACSPVVLGVTGTRGFMIFEQVQTVEVFYFCSVLFLNSDRWLVSRLVDLRFFTSHIR